MTEQHFETVAAILANERADQDRRGQALIDLLAGRLAAAFITFNPNFNSDRFLAACRGDR